VLHESVFPFLAERFTQGHHDTVSIQECLDPVVAPYLLLHERMTHLDQAAKMLDLFLGDVGTGECSKPEHLREALGIQLVVLGDQLTKLDSICDLDVVVISEKILI
jgi:hypothetical protein